LNKQWHYQGTKNYYKTQSSQQPSLHKNAATVNVPARSSYQMAKPNASFIPNSTILLLTLKLFNCISLPLQSAGLQKYLPQAN
jgi:hypothetical protein